MMVDHSIGLEREDKLSIQGLLDRFIGELDVFDAFAVCYLADVLYFLEKDLQDA